MNDLPEEIIDMILSFSNPYRDQYSRVINQLDTRARSVILHKAMFYALCISRLVDRLTAQQPDDPSGYELVQSTLHSLILSIDHYIEFPPTA